MNRTARTVTSLAILLGLGHAAGSASWQSASVSTLAAFTSANPNSAVETFDADPGFTDGNTIVFDDFTAEAVGLTAGIGVNDVTGEFGLTVSSIPFTNVVNFTFNEEVTAIGFNLIAANNLITIEQGGSGIATLGGGTAGSDPFAFGDFVVIDFGGPVMSFTVSAPGLASVVDLDNLALAFVFDCVADTNNDGELTPGDFNAWVLAFNNQTAECDQNGDGLCTPGDFNAWILNFNTGCP
ncbi:MAG: GC-type dockerin domain-anchored protein [Planctomycetota bacterium]